MIDVAEILVHWHAGRSLNEMSQSLGVDRKTLRKYVAPAVAAGIEPGGPAKSEGEWHELVREWFPELAGTRLRQVTWSAVAEHHDYIVEQLKCMPIERMTVDQILALPVTVDVPTAGRAFGYGRRKSYELAAAGQLPVPVLWNGIKGCRKTVNKADLMRALGMAYKDEPAKQEQASQIDRGNAPSDPAELIRAEVTAPRTGRTWTPWRSPSTPSPTPSSATPPTSSWPRSPHTATPRPIQGRMNDRPWTGRGAAATPAVSW